MRYLGIDYGERRVGVAVSDETGTLAFPLVVLRNSNELLKEVLQIIEKEKIETVVLGESLNFAGEPNVVMENIEEFKKELQAASKLKVVYEPEFLTSVQATQFQPKNEMHDASAAALILQSYLNRDKIRE